MHTYLIFLRGINVGGHRKIKMADLRLLLSRQGFKKVSTYIQSGNIILKSEQHSDKVKASIENSILSTYGFEVPVLVLSPKILQTVLQNIPYTMAETKNLYFTLLFSTPSEEAITAFKALTFSTEAFEISKHCIYLNCKQGAGKAKLNNNLIEKHLGVMTTTRNLNTMNNMLSLAQ